eukprot:8809650-Alexandrium_andersonii.AAC.1
MWSKIKLSSSVTVSMYWTMLKVARLRLAPGGGDEHLTWHEAQVRLSFSGSLRTFSNQPVLLVGGRNVGE